MILDYLLLIFSILFSSEILFFLFGINKSSRTKRNKEFEPFVSIIVAARNEESNIIRCLNSLSKIDYPTNKIEIVIVNDQSEDKTELLIRNFIKNKMQFKCINTTSGFANLIGKANALAQGIDASTGEILLFTDADCVVPKTWIRETVSFFTDDVGIVGGFTILDVNNSFQGIQSLDWLYVYTVACAASTLGYPLTAVGNNLAVRRSAYYKVGGYQNIPFSVTEDYALTQAILKSTKYKMIFPFSTKTLVTSLPCTTMLELYRQKIRWGVGGLNMVPAGYIVFGIAFVFKLLLLITMFIQPNFIFFLSLGLKLMLDYILILFLLVKIKKFKLIKYFILFEIYFFLYVIILPAFACFSKTIIWKDRKL